MALPSAQRVAVTARQRRLLAHLARAASTPQAVATRARIILGAADGESNRGMAQRLQLARNTVQAWRDRCVGAAEALLAAEAEGGPDDDRALDVVVRGVLADAPRPGAPPTFTPEQLCQLMAVACEPPGTRGGPSASGRPVNWPTRPSSAASSPASPPAASGGSWFLEAAALKPHHSRYWLTPRVDDPAAFAAQVQAVCDLYAAAPALHAQGVHVVSTD
jgi:hypothetical protein